VGKGKRTRAIKKADVTEPQAVRPPSRTAGGEVVASHSQYSGPLPHPEMMRQYNEIHPGFADRIIASWEKETAHRHNLETLAVRSEIDKEKAISEDVKRGQWLAFWLACAFLGAGSFLVYSGYQITGALFGATGFVGIVLAFLNTAFNSRDNSNGNEAADNHEK